MLSMLAATLTLSDCLVYRGDEGPGKGKHLVLLAGDDEYRSEEGLPMLARILAFRHGFTCTVLFSIGADGTIDPEAHGNQPGLEALDQADLVIMLLRFRAWPDAQMRHFVDFYKAGKPIVALRTSTHAFDYPADSASPYRKFGWRSQEWPGGFGKQVLGEHWISHWGDHAKQATRGLIESSTSRSPILRGVGDVFVTSDVYEADPPADATILMRGKVVAGMNSSDPDARGLKKTVKGNEQLLNDPMMPIVWTREPLNEAGRRNRVFTSTMGAATDLESEGLRRLLVNAVFWGLKMERRIPAKADVRYVGPYRPSPFGFGTFRRGMRPNDFAWPAGR